jgi:hypothetical protein
VLEVDDGFRFVPVNYTDEETMLESILAIAGE